jgi:alkaline phosphatase
MANTLLFRVGVVLSALVMLVSATPTLALVMYPIDRADILAGSQFDFKVEFDGVVTAADVKITVNGDDGAAVLGRALTLVPREPGVDASALIARDVVLTKPGRYTVVATDGKQIRTVTWQVFSTGPRQAKNVILFIGDGMSMAHRTAARILSKGMAEGKYRGALAMDTMPHMARVGTAGVDSIITDSANSMSAYTTGHKSSVNALGVYADRTPDTLDDPRVETISSLVKRCLGLAV